MSPVTIEVDWTRCDGHGLCAAMAPGRIRLDDWGFPVVDGRRLEPDEIRDARAAALACPTLSLRVTRSTGADARP